MSRVALGGGLESLGALREALRVAAVSAWRAQGRVTLPAAALGQARAQGSCCSEQDAERILLLAQASFAALMPNSCQGPSPEQGSACSTAQILKLQTYSEVHWLMASTAAAGSRCLVRNCFWGGRKGSRTRSCAQLYPHAKGPPAQVHSAEPTSVVTQRENKQCCSASPASTHTGRNVHPQQSPGRDGQGLGTPLSGAPPHMHPHRDGCTHTHTRAAAHRGSHRCRCVSTSVLSFVHMPSDVHTRLSCTRQGAVTRAGLREHTCSHRYTVSI